MYNNSLEQIKELRKVHTYDYRIKFELVKEKTHRVKSSRVQIKRSHVLRNKTFVTLLPSMCEKMQEVLPTHLLT